ncbi:hypothetical protein HDV00_001121 [Rhizophlyctis rosea]|nr:hypothetical protein HDV00_001121 [Rhizophlyctis rosea]
MDESPISYGRRSLDFSADAARRLRDVEEENQMLKDQLRALMDQIVNSELDYARRQNELNTMHLQEMETMTMQHMAETNHLREERDALAEELRNTQETIEDLNQKLNDTSETATFVTKNSEGWQQAEIERLQKQSEAERKLLHAQLLESAKQRIMLQTALEQLEDEFERVKDEYTSAQLQLDDLREQLAHHANKVVTPSHEKRELNIARERERESRDRERSASVVSVTSLIGFNINGVSKDLEDIKL